MKQRINLFLAIFLPLQLVGISILKSYPELIETYYSKGIYPYIGMVLRYALGWIPFSVGDFFYALLIFLLIRWLIKRIRSGFRNPKQWTMSALASLSALYFAFHLLWGFNYYRLPLHESMNIGHDYTKEELTRLCEKLLVKTNRLHRELVVHDSLKVAFPFTHSQLKNQCIAGYQALEKDFPQLTYHGKSIKPSLFTIPLTYMGFNGYLNPFTGEAQINNWIPDFKLPSTISHEMGHQLGFAKENEANFMACLNTMNHDNSFIRYAGYTFALKYALGDLYIQEPCAAENLIAQLHAGIKKNYREVDLFWEAHENPLEPFFKQFYGGYLQANNQPQGIESYNYVVALLVNYFEKAENL